MIDLDELVEVGRAVEGEPTAFAAVQKLIASSPSLLDVRGLPPEREPDNPLRERVLDALLANPDRWLTTEEVRAACKTRQSQGLLIQLRDLRADGEIESRAKGSGNEWRSR